MTGCSTRMCVDARSFGAGIRRYVRVRAPPGPLLSRPLSNYSSHIRKTLGISAMYGVWEVGLHIYMVLRTCLRAQELNPILSRYKRNTKHCPEQGGSASVSLLHVPLSVVLLRTSPLITAIVRSKDYSICIVPRTEYRAQRSIAFHI